MDQQITGNETISQVFTSIRQNERYRRLDTLGQELRRVEIYANKHIINDDFSVAMVNIALVAYRTGVAPAIQVNASLFLNRLFQLEFPYSLSVRGLIEVAGRVHKAKKSVKQHLNAHADLRRASERLLKRFIPGGGGGHNVMTYVQSLSKQVQDVEAAYEELSNYAHGDFQAHALARATSFFSNLRGDESPVIAGYDDLLNDAWRTLFDDLDYIRSVLAPLIARVSPEEGDCIGADVARELNSDSE